jgi:hypothetical protein
MGNTSLAVKLQRNRFLKEHLRILSILTGRKIEVSELGSQEQFLSLRQHSRSRLGQPTTKFEVVFSEKKSHRFKSFVQRLKSANPSPVYVVSPYADSCGLLMVGAIDEVNFDFEFSISSEGIFIFVTKDFGDRILLDFYENESGQEMLIVETQGANWGTVSY